MALTLPLGLPPIPATRIGLLGPMQVIRLPETAPLDYVGLASRHPRRELLVQELGDLPAEWRILHHEWVHMALMDSGVGHVLSQKLEEAVCDAVAAARFIQQLAGEV